VCDYCGTHCFCEAKKGLLPRKRGAVVASPVAAAPAVVDAAAPVAAVAAPAVVEDVAPAVVDEGILALLAYED
jgi:hypothetical protein